MGGSGRRRETGVPRGRRGGNPTPSARPIPGTRRPWLRLYPMTTPNSHEPQSRPRVPILFTGGTISMRVDPAAGGAVPALSGRELLELAPGAGEIAALEAVEFDRVAGWRVTPEWMGKLAEAVRSALAAPDAAGVVVTHGTDTL